MQSAGDYNRFKLLMRTKNEQLHNEALEMLRQKRDNPDGSSNANRSESNEEFSEEDINEAIRQSLAEHVAERKALVEEKREVDRALAVSVAGLLKSNVEAEESHQITTNAQVEPVDESPAKGAIIRLLQHFSCGNNVCYYAMQGNREIPIRRKWNGVVLC